MWRDLAAWAVVVGLAAAVPAVRADDKDDDHPHPVTKRVKDAKDHHEDAHAVTKAITTTAATKKIHDEKHARGKGYEAHAVMKDGKVGDVTVKDVKTGKNTKLRMVKSTKNPFKKPAKCGEENINLGDDDCGTQVSTFWYGWYYMNPYTNYYMYYWYPSTYVYYQPVLYPSVYDYTSYVVYY